MQTIEFMEVQRLLCIYPKSFAIETKLLSKRKLLIYGIDKFGYLKIP